MQPEQAFERQLETLRRNCETAAQCFYGHQAINEVALRRPAVHRALNRNSVFWVTTAGAMQAATFIAIGRVFDQGSLHNVDRLLQLAQNQPSLFAKEALRKRKQGRDAAAPSWLDAYMQGVYVPRAADFRRLRSHIKNHRQLYEKSYRALRDKHFAHTELDDDADIDSMFSKTSKREIERILLFLIRLHDALWHLYMNGHRPTLRTIRGSVKPSGRLILPRTQLSGVHRRMTRDTADVLKRIAAQPAVAADGAR
jgi:AbiU2